MKRPIKAAPSTHKSHNVGPGDEMKKLGQAYYPEASYALGGMKSTGSCPN